MLSIEPSGLDGADKELGSVGVGLEKKRGKGLSGTSHTSKTTHAQCTHSSVGHRKDARTGVGQLEVFILELIAVDGLSTSTVVVGEIASLAHELRDDTVERRSLVSKSLFPSTQGTEVLGGFRNDIGAKFHDNTADTLAADGHIEENTRERHDSLLV
uniref:Uncharacterized protein n=1 Tax=Entomoneis paludosa TaxID=265537 RepID=A0A7S2V998_9STRA